MAKPDKFMLAHAPHVQEALESLGGSWGDIYVVTAAMSWDLDRDKPCLMFTVQVTEDDDGVGVAIILVPALIVVALGLGITAFMFSRKKGEKEEVSIRLVWTALA